jgi:hypothetical protein
MDDCDKKKRPHIDNLDTTFNIFPQDAFDRNNESAFIVKDTEENRELWSTILLLR